jgi:ABC-type nitrate/sulfonate/bicarbonate transport system ATPase subunit
MTSATPPKLQIRGVGKRFDNVEALTPVSLDVQANEFVCIVGASGCGKSTLFNIVSGLLAPSEGSVLLDGKEIVNRPGQVGYMLQKDLLLPWRTALQNIVLGPALRGTLTQADYDRAAALATRYGLGSFLHAYPHALSGGMRQRVALMRTLTAGNDTLLLDEPFGALDYQTRVAMQSWLLDVWREMQRTIVFVTHDVDESIFLADRVVIMTPRPGRIHSVLPIDLPRPRMPAVLSDPAFMAAKRTIMEVLHPAPETTGSEAAAHV